jgi:hypothetical protein
MLNIFSRCAQLTLSLQTQPKLWAWPSPPRPPSPNTGRGGRKTGKTRILLPSPKIGRGAVGEGHLGHLPMFDLSFDYVYLLSLRENNATILEKNHCLYSFYYSIKH